MSEPLAALERLMNAESEKEAAAILAESPELLSPEIDDMLAEEIESARREGDKELVTLLAELRQLLSSLRSLAEWTPPDLPGAEIAADLIHMLGEPTMKVPIPRSALSEVFFLVVEDLRRHAEKHHIDEITRELRRLDKRIAAAGGRYAVPDGETPLLVTLEEWVNTETWSESQTYLAQHKQLLSADTAAVLSILQQGARRVEAEEDEYLMRQHLSILAAARAGNASGVYAKLIADEESADEEDDEDDEDDEDAGGHSIPESSHSH